MQPRYLAGLLVLAVLVWGHPLVAQAAPVGRFVQVEGSVDVMKGGKFPAVPVKVQDEVEQGDAVRTKSQSRAQIRFVDDTVLTLAPESRVAIDEYVYDAAKSKRQATVEVFRGMAHFLVSKILQTEKPDFIMKTQTGIMGVRGTAWYAMLTALYTDIYNEQGTTEVQNLFPEISGKVTLTGMQFTRVGLNLPPTFPLPFTLQDLEGLKIQFKNYTGGSGGGSNTGSPLETGTLGPGGGPGGVTGGPGAGTGSNPINNPTISLYTNNNLLNNPLNNPLITSSTSSPGPISSTYAFTMDLYGYGTNTITSLDNASHTGGSWGELTGVDPEYFTTSGSGTRVSASFTGPTGTATTFTNSDILSGTVSGVSGQSLTGTYSATWNTSTGYTGTFSGPITINPNGTFSYSYTNLSGSNGTYTITGAGSSSGTRGTYFTESISGSYAAVSGGSNPIILLNTGQMTGSQTVSGVSPDTNGSLALSYNGSGLPALNAGATGTMSLNGSGVVSPGSGGQETYGVLSATVTVNSTSSQTAMQITYDPTTGNLIGQVANGGGSSAAYINAILATTPTGTGLATRSFAESLSGGYQLTSNSPYTTASITNSGSLSGAMWLGGMGGIAAYRITSNFNLTGTSAAGAFPGSASGSASFNMIGAAIGPTNGILTGTAMGSLNSSSFRVAFGGPYNNFTINTDPTLPVGSTLPATLTFSPQNSTGTINGYPMSVSGTWNQIDPPLPGMGTAATTAGAWANASLLSNRLTQLTGTSLGSRIQGAAQLTQAGARGNPALAANLRAAWRFHREQRTRQAVLRAASGTHPRGPGG